MAQPLILKVRIVEQNVTKVIQFDSATLVFDACHIVREKITDSNLREPKDYGLFLPGEDGQGVWFEPGRELRYYVLKNQDLIEYRRKIRQLKVRMLDGTVKTLMVDDSQPVSQMMVVICTKIGIMNHDEYSLVREIEQEEMENKQNFGTLTLRKKKEGEKERDIKMENLKKKLRTDDEIDWVDHSKTLREQGINENEVLLLRKKYFFSDGNIDSQDPIQLNLLYVQCRDDIVNETHPVTQEKACEFAGIQCQVQFGDFNEGRHKPGFLDLREFMPHSYIKVKGIEKKVFNHHKLHSGKSELDAKFRYVEEARSLKTYGVTFFLVKEKMKNRNKLAPRLLGITKESVLRLDEKTKEILKTWPLTTVKRWAASPNTFTLDFGDYSDQYFPFQTTEGEQIAQLIAGYIDIILKKQRSIGYAGDEGNEGLTLYEDLVARMTSNIIQQDSHEPQHMKQESISRFAIIPGSQGIQGFKTGSMMTGTQSVSVKGKINEAHQIPTVQQQKVSKVALSKPQQSLLSTIDSGQTIITSCINDFEVKAELPELGTDPASVRWKQVTLDSNKQTVMSQIAAMNAATAEVVTLTSSVHDEVDHTAVGTAIHTITSNLPEMTKGAKMIASLLESNSDSSRLLQETKTFCSAFSEFLIAAEPGRIKPRQHLLGAATRVGDASKAVLTTIDEYPNQETQNILLGLAKAVANTTAALTLKTKAVANQSENQEIQNKVINAATNCALTISQLSACAKVVAPTIDTPACQKQLIEASKEVEKAVESIVNVSQEATNDEKLLRDLSLAAAEATQALNDLLNYIKIAGDWKGKTPLHEEAMETILISSERLFAFDGNSSEMVRQANVLALATTELINSIKIEASSVTDNDIQMRLFAAAKALAEATARMVEATKECAEKPHDRARQEKLISTADNIRIAAYMAAGNALKKKIMKRLENAAKHAMATATQCMIAGQGASNYNSSITSHDELISDCNVVADVIPQLVEGVKGTINNPDSQRAQANLINACNQFLQSGTKMVSSVKSALPTVTDQASSMQLSNSSKQFNQALADLRTAMSKVQEAYGTLEMENAIDSIQALDEDLVYLKNSAADGSLRPLPGETAENSAQYLTNCIKTVGSTIAQLLTSASQANQHYTGLASRDTDQALKEFCSAVRGVVATTSEYEVRIRIIDAAREVMIKSLKLIEEARTVAQSPHGVASQQKLAQVAKGVSLALNKTVSCLPGQKDVDDAIKNISDYTNDIDASNFPISTKPYGEIQTELSNAASDLNDASTEVVNAARQSTQHLALSSKKFSTAFGSLMGVGMEMAGTAKDQEIRGNIVISLKSVSIELSKFLVSAKSIAGDPHAPNAKNQLQSAARAVTESINNLIDVCTSSAPGQKECESAIRAIQSMAPLLDQPSEPINDASYFECLENVMDRSKSLGEEMTRLARHAKNMELHLFGIAVKAVSSALCGLVESAAQSAYLVSISDKSSVAGRPGLVNQSQFAHAYQAIQSACQTLNDPNINLQQVLNAATIIDKYTSDLCNCCREASVKTNNSFAKNHFVQSEKYVNNATTHLVKKIKLLDQDFSSENRTRCGDATQPLLEAVENLCTFANSPEFASVPAKISMKAREEQIPITKAGRSIIEGSCAMIEDAKSLAVNPKDPATWQALASHSKNVSNSIKNLVSSIRDKAPGQRECDEAVDTLNINIRDLDQASLCVMDENLPQYRDNNLLGYNEQVETTCQALLTSIDRVRNSAKNEAENLGHAINQMSSYLTPLVNSAIGCASNMTNSKQQACVLDQTKSVLECALQLMYASKESGGNSKAVHAHPEIDESADSMKETIQELLSTGESIATEAGVVSGLVESITSSINRCSETSHYPSDELGSFAIYQSRMVDSAKEIIRIVQEMVSKSTIDSCQLGNLGATLSHEYNKLASCISGANQLAPSHDMANTILTCVQEVGQTCIDLVKCGGACQATPRNTYCQRDLAESARHVGVKVTSLLAVLKETSQGTQACIDASSTVSGIIGDLDTTILFATAGTLNAENETEAFSDHREHILRTTKALAEYIYKLVAGATSSQEELASTAQNSVSTIVELTEVIKSGAASLGANNQEAQVMLINAVKDVAMALGDLIHATKTASGKSVDDPAISNLKESAKVMVTNVASLLKSVKAVENEQMRGTQALEGTIEAIAQEIRAFNSEEEPKTRSTPEELVKMTKPITMASAKAVSAGLSLKQDDVIAAANLGRKSVSDMLTTCKGAAWSQETKELRLKVMSTGHNTAVQYRELLQIVLDCLQKQNPDSKSSLSVVSRKIAQCVTNLVSVAEQLKGDDWEDPEDPTVIAENELLGAANSIEAAARKLQSLRPRKTHAKEVDEENMNFEEIILDACKSIAAAAEALINAASRAQSELVISGKIKSRPTIMSDDGQWSEGLISAARLVAASIHSLCEAANSLVQGLASEEKLIASAKQVAASTAQLLVACKVKADPNSEAMERLQEAGSKVKKATNSLVQAAQQAIEQEVEEMTPLLKIKPVQRIVQDLDMREKILKLENELKRTREMQKIMRTNVSGQSDIEGNHSRNEHGHESSVRDSVSSVSYMADQSSTQTSSHRQTYEGNLIQSPIESSFNRMSLQNQSPSISTYHKSSFFTTINQTPKRSSSYDQNNSFNDSLKTERPQAEIVEGPSFKDAMKRFQTS